MPPSYTTRAGGARVRNASARLPADDWNTTSLAGSAARRNGWRLARTRRAPRPWLPPRLTGRRLHLLRVAQLCGIAPRPPAQATRKANPLLRKTRPHRLPVYGAGEGAALSLCFGPAFHFSSSSPRPPLPTPRQLALSKRMFGGGHSRRHFASLRGLVRQLERSAQLCLHCPPLPQAWPGQCTPSSLCF